MDITKIDLWGCLQSPERDAFWVLLEWYSAHPNEPISVFYIDPLFIGSVGGGLKRRDAWIAATGLYLEILFPGGEDPEPVYIATDYSAFAEWIALWDDGDLSFLASCTIPLFP